MASKRSNEQRMVVDYKKRTYVTSGGVLLHLRPVSVVMYENIRADTEGRPEVPMSTVTYGDDMERQEPNPNDPQYLADLSRWQEAHNIRGMSYLWTAGITDEPSDEEMTRLRKFLPNADDLDLKFNWLTELMPTDQETRFITEAIIGQSMVTTEGIAESAAIFPSDSERSIDSDLPVPAEADPDNAEFSG